MSETATSKPAPQRENLLLSMAFNIVIPLLILTKLSKEEYLGPVLALIIGLSFPLAYGIWDLFKRKQVNFVSVLGLISVGLSGTFALMELDPFWLAIKEASIPLVIGVMVLVTFNTRRPLIKTFLYNPQVLNTELIDQKLEETNTRKEFNKVFAFCNWLLVLSFGLSAVLNYILARMIVTTHPAVDKVAFNGELGKMNALSWPVIVIPSTVIMMFALWKLISGLSRLTGLKMEEMMHEPPKKKGKS
ncbi:MAG: MFS transporter [Verrucomicrobiae bacterium]|nr:MFS transporter [Verrucomicrobiae bacterium]